MNGLFSVPASRLHGRPLIYNEERFDVATLFPFFDREGFVERVLIVDADSSDLRSFPADTALFRIPLWGPVRVSGERLEIVADIIDRLAELWHYDPRWLLKDQRFESHSAVTALQLTNCADSFERQPSDVLFNPRLTAVNKVQFRALADNYEKKPFQSDMLPNRETRQSQRTPALSPGWHLDPMW